MAQSKPADTELGARIDPTSWPTGCSRRLRKRWTSTKETEATRKLYGLDDPGNARPSARTACWRGGWWSAACGSSSCTAAAAAAGTRTATWKATTRKWCQASDKPIAGLLTDLKARGMLEDTLVVWGGEFGRTPFNEKRQRPRPQSVGLHDVDGGRRRQGGPGTSAPPTRSGLRAVEKPVHVHDLHATILYCWAWTTCELTYLHNGRAERPTVNGGKLITELL